MSDTNAVNWPSVTQVSQLPQQATANQNAALDLAQKQRALSAFRGIKLGDPASVQQGISALTGLGMTDQAKSVLDLANQRTINTQSVPLTVNALGMANDALTAKRQGSTSQPSLDDLNAAHRQIFQQGADAVNDLLNYDDPTLRAAAADVYKHKFAQMGIPKQNIDEVFGDLSTDGLKAHEKYLTAAAGGDTTAEHPTGYAASQALLNSDPIYRNAEGTLTGPMADPTVQAALKQYGGLDLGPGMQQALEETAPGRAQAATAAFAPTNAFSTTTATNLANLNTEPEVTRAVSQAAAEGSAAGSQMKVTLKDGSTETGVIAYDQDHKPYFVPTGEAPPASGGRAGPAIGSPSEAGGQKLAASGQQYAGDLSSAASSQPTQVALRKAVDLLPSTNVGPGVQVVNNWRSFILSQLPKLAPLIPGGLKEAQVQTANTNELQKYMVQIAGGAAAQYGQGTNEKLAFATSGNPHISMDKLSALDVSRMNLALQRAQNAKPYLFGTTGQDPGQYSEFASNYARTVDPRAFMLDLLPVADRNKLLASITTPQDRIKFQRGVQAAEAAGYFTRADLPR